MTDILFDSLTGVRGCALQELRRSPLEADERGRVDTVGQISPDGTDGRAVADTESDCVRGVIEVLQVTLVKM